MNCNWLMLSGFQPHEKFPVIPAGIRLRDMLTALWCLSQSCWIGLARNRVTPASHGTRANRSASSRLAASASRFTRSPYCPKTRVRADGFNRLPEPRT